MTHPMQARSAAFQSCVDEIFRQCPFLIERWTSKLVNAMHERSLVAADSWERRQLQDAIAVLKKQRKNIEDGFCQQLKEVMAADVDSAGSSKKSVTTGRSLSSVSFDELELMGDTQVQQVVESGRLNQLVSTACEAGLANFSARLSTAQGLLQVKGDSNPFRPEIMAHALMELLQSLPVSVQTRAYWLLDGARLMGEELQALYVFFNDFLAGQGIALAPYGAPVALQGRTAGLGTGARGDSPPQQAMAFSAQAPAVQGRAAVVSETEPLGRKPLLTLDHLHHLLVGDYDDADHKPTSFSEFGTDEFLRQDFSHTVPAALDVLTELEEQGLVSGKVKLSRPPPPAPVADLRARLKTNAKTLGQSLAIEVVGLMIEQMATDERLLPPVRQVIAHVEPAFLRLAVTDPRFFSEKSHPARRLLEAVTRASMGYASENSPGFPDFVKDLRALGNQLGSASESSDFAVLLKEFDSRQSRNTLESRKAQRVAVQALVQAEQRNLMAASIALEIKARPDFTDENRLITAFLTGPWAQVMAQERLAGQGKTFDGSPAVFSLALDDVLWSLNVEQATRQRHRLLQMIPDLLTLLKRGLSSIDYPVEQSRPFFDELMAVHCAALKSAAELLAQSPAESPQGSHHALAKMFEADSQLMPLWLAPSEVQDSGFMAEKDEMRQPRPTNTLSEPEHSAPDAPLAPSLKIELSLGDWVDLLVDMQWLRAELTWVSPQGTLFMFTSQGGRKHSMTSRVLRHLFTLNLVKVISQQGVVEGALDCVARTAMHNSLQA